MGASYVEGLIRVRILLDDNRIFQIGTSMKEMDRVKLPLFLVQNVDVFA